MAPNNIATTDYVKDFVNGVEAEAASRVTALEMSKQSKVMFSPVTVDGEEKKTVEGAISAINTMAGNSKTCIGTLSDLKTTTKTNLVSAINEQWSSAHGVVTSGWYTVAEITMSSQGYVAGGSNLGFNGIIEMSRGFNYTNNEAYTLIFNCMYEHCTFDVTGICGVNLIKKIRAVYDSAVPNKTYIQVLVDGLTSNYLGVKLIFNNSNQEVLSYSAVVPTLNTIIDANLVVLGETTLCNNTISDRLEKLERDCKIYTFRIDPDEDDSYEAVSYRDDAVGMTPASMGATSFNYGSWEAFINKICKPCMLKFDGTVDYYLDPNDYSKKLDGTPSDVSDLSYPGNAMVEFPLLWWKSWGDGWVSIADHQVDATYKCYSNLDANGNIIPYFYLPIYNGCIYDGKMRSISGIQLKSWSTTAYSNSATYAVGAEVNYNNRMWKCITAVTSPENFNSSKWEQFPFNANTTGEEEITYATANNTTAKVEWYTDVWCDRVLINALLVLIGKCIDTQGTFGRGIDSVNQAAKEAYVTGSLDNKGLFYGSTSNGSTAVKVFGMENWWACEWRRTAGLIGGANNTYLYKMTASTVDGSTANGYNTNGSGYITASGRPSETTWLKKMQFGTFGILPLEVGSYSTQYYKDHYWTGTSYAHFGGTNSTDSGCGAFCFALSVSAGARTSSISTSLSCKPVANSCKSISDEPTETEINSTINEIWQ